MNASEIKNTVENRPADATGKDDAAFKDVIMQIHQNIIALKNRLQTI